MRRRDAWIGAYRYGVAHGYISWVSRLSLGVGIGLVFAGVAADSGRPWLVVVAIALVWPALVLYGLHVEVDEYRERARREGWG